MDALILAMALAAQAAAPPAEPYRASGREPSAWSLTIAGGQMVFESPGRPPISVTAPRPATGDGTTRYRTRRLDVGINHGPPPCDGADDRRFADSVFVTVGRTEYAGCGGAELPADSLDGTSWHFAEIAGEDTGLTGDIFRDDRYAVDFSADAMLGYGGCNRFSAGYSRAGDTLTTRPPYGMGQRACPDPIMSRERRLFEILSRPMRLSFPDRETMLLTGEAGAIRLTRTRSPD
ncbi:MAG TPA: META domain-containing protein [Allosphingosinicella sp.]|nr:META domain-containing protein [Allosphingosinicella sp.]